MIEILTGFAIAVVIFIIIYNFLISKKNQVENIFAGVDALLKKRFDLIPNIVATTKQYQEHEKTLLEEVTRLRSLGENSHSNEQKLLAASQLSPVLGRLMVSLEAYPELKANQNFLHLQNTLNEIEEQISAARRAYNQAVTDYNNAIEMFPANIVANMLSYQRKIVFEAKGEERQNIDVGDLFKN